MPLIRFCAVALALLAVSCAHRGPVAASGVTPEVDHHQHLLSPAGAELVNRTLPAVELPPEIARVVSERVTRWNDRSALRELYTDDSFVLVPEAPGWFRGGERVADLLSAGLTRPFDLKPVVYRANASSAQVAGYFVRREDSAQTPVAHFFLALERQADGAWRIAAELPVLPLEFEQIVTAEELIEMLDEAGIGRAVILSDAYYFDAPELDRSGALAAVRAENDWTAAQARRYPERLVAFCSLNPLEEYAVAEIDRCAATGHFRGLKLHFQTSGVNLLNADHVRQLRAVAAAANRNRLAMILHVRSGGDYGDRHARVLLDDVLVAAPDVPVQIAHLWGGETFSSAALAVYAEAAESHHPSARNLYFDLAQIASMGEDAVREAVTLMRRIGVQRLLYGSDGPQFGGMPPAAAWERFRTRVTLTEEELRTIAGNVAPYMR